MQLLGTASTPIPGTHRWSSAPRWRKRPDARGLDPAQRAYLHDVRWRRLPVSRREVGLVLAATLLLHVLAMVGASYNMRVQPVAVQPTYQRHVIQVELIERSPAAAPSPPPPQVLPDMQVRPPQAAVPRIKAPVAAITPPPVKEAANPEAASAELFDDQGKVILPAAATTTGRSVPDYQAGILHSDARPAQPQSPIQYKSTRFEKDWVPSSENVLQKAVRKTIMEATVVRLPGGTRIKCVVAPLALAGGCFPTGPEQLSAPLHVEFKRNNLPSATPLIKPSEAASRAKPATPASVAPAPAGSARGS